MIQACRDIAPTKIMTTATREYALAMSQAFNFGFSPEDIIGRDDYSYEVQTAYGSKMTMLIDINQDRESILIDDRNAEHIYTQEKMKYLGIDHHQVYPIRKFTGGKDPEKFETQEWPQIIRAILA